MSRHETKPDFTKWEALIKGNELLLKKELNDIELGALYDCIEDCREGFIKIYSNYLVSLNSAISCRKPLQVNDYEQLLDALYGIKFEFEHIKNHIIDAEKGFWELSQILEVE